MLNQAIILQNLEAASFNKPVYVHVLDSIDSTNRFLKDLPASDVTEVCCAEMQTRGRGRFGRSWHSPSGENIYFSIRIRFDCDLSQLSGLSLVVSMAVLSMLDNAGMGDDVLIKWPNDLLWNGKKLCGNLIEVVGGSEVVIGIGLNVNSRPGEQVVIDKPWCSLYEMRGHQFDRNTLIGQLIIQLDQHVEQFLTHGFVSFISKWQEIDYLYGKAITLSQPSGHLSGKANGINEAGQLILIDETGAKHFLASGETSLSQILGEKVSRCDE